MTQAGRPQARGLRNPHRSTPIRKPSQRDVWIPVPKSRPSEGGPASKGGIEERGGNLNLQEQDTRRIPKRTSSKEELDYEPEHDERHEAHPAEGRRRPGCRCRLGQLADVQAREGVRERAQRGGAGRDGRGVRPLSHVHAVRQLQFRRHHEGRCRRQHRGRPRSREQRRNALPARQERHHERVQPASHQGAHEAHQPREGLGGRPRLGGDHLGRGARHGCREDPRMLRHGHPQARADVQLRPL